MERFRLASSRWPRLAVILGAALLVWFVLDRYVSSLLAAAVAFVLVTLASSIIGERAPRLVEVAAGDEPVRTVIGDDSSVYSDGWMVALPRDVLDGEHPARGAPTLEARRRFIEIGGFDVGATSLRLGVEGRSSDVVTITGIRALVGESHPAIAHTFIRSPSAGEGKAIELEIELDDANPVARSKGEDYFKSGYVTLVKGEVQVFQLVARTRAQAYTWRLELRYNVRGSEDAVVLDNGGMPFRTTATAASFAQSYDWAWYEGHNARLVPLLTSD